MIGAIGKYPMRTLCIVNLLIIFVHQGEGRRHGQNEHYEVPPSPAVQQGRSSLAQYLQVEPGSYNQYGGVPTKYPTGAKPYNSYPEPAHSYHQYPEPTKPFYYPEPAKPYYHPEPAKPYHYPKPTNPYPYPAHPNPYHGNQHGDHGNSYYDYRPPIPHPVSYPAVNNQNKGYGDVPTMYPTGTDPYAHERMGHMGYYHQQGGGGYYHPPPQRMPGPYYYPPPPTEYPTGIPPTPFPTLPRTAVPTLMPTPYPPPKPYVAPPR